MAGTFVWVGITTTIVLVAVGGKGVGDARVAVGSVGSAVAVLATTAEVGVAAGDSAFVTARVGVNVLVAPITLPTLLHHQ